jgi:3-hydroxyacyl-CoA dehydrogenase
MHFFNPAHRMKLVEIIPGLNTSASTIQSCMDFGEKLGKLAIRVEECPSFLVNRLLGRYMNEALWCLTDGLASVEEIDDAVCQYIMPIGPLALRDMNGADIGLAVAQYNYQEYGERFLPAPILKAMVDANMLGRKTGSGFYNYDPDTNKRTHANPEILNFITSNNGAPGRKGKKSKFQVDRLFIPMINEAFLVLQEKVCSIEDLDPALMAGLGMRKGPIALASDIGFENILKELESAFNDTGDERFRPAPLLKRYVWAGKTTVG